MTLFGVEIIPRRRVQLARFDRPLARELFVRHALVEGEWDPSHLDKRLTAFERRNLELRRRLEKIEERERRRDILVGDEAVYAFYDARIPRDVFDVRSFEAWWRDAATRTPRLLDMTEADLVDDASRGDERDFPARWRQADQVLIARVPLRAGRRGRRRDRDRAARPARPGCGPDGFDWQVPGMRDELITALLRSLPKAIRRHVVPAADWAARFAEELAGQGPEAHEGLPPTTLRDALAARIQRVANQPVTAADFELDRVPAPPAGLVPRGGRARARRRVGSRPRRAAAAALGPRPRLRREVAEPNAAASGVSRRRPIPPARAPPLRRPESASHRAHRPHRLGLRRPARGRRHARSPAAWSAAIRRSSTRAPRSRCASRRRPRLPSAPPARACAGSCCWRSPRPPRTCSSTSRLPRSSRSRHRRTRRRRRSSKTAAWRWRMPSSRAPRRRAVVRTRAELRTRARCVSRPPSSTRLFQTVSLAARILTAAREVDRALRAQNSLTLLGALNDVKGQIAGLVFPGFVSRIGLARLAHLPRYLRGALERVDGLVDNPGRDRQRMTEFERAAAVFAEAGGVDPARRRRAGRTRARPVAARGVPHQPVRAARSARPSRSRCSASRSPCATEQGIVPTNREVGPAMAQRDRLHRVRRTRGPAP